MKPKVLVALLTGTERQFWINSELVVMLLHMVRDPRYTVEVATVKDSIPHEVARNHTIKLARDHGFDWLVSFDNDNYMPLGTPLDIIAAAGPAQQSVIGLTYGLKAPDVGYMLYPGCGGVINGLFQEVPCVAGGVLMVNKRVWEKIPEGPWFRWVHGDGEETLDRGRNSCGEDVYFSNLCKRNGLSVWTHKQLLAGHYRTTDLTVMVSTMAQLQRGGKHS